MLQESPGRDITKRWKFLEIGGKLMGLAKLMREDVMLAYVSELVSLEVSVTQISLIMVFYLVQEV
jgi:hypothetical protein